MRASTPAAVRRLERPVPKKPEAKTQGHVYDDEGGTAAEATPTAESL